jgi:maltose alpha-D-glucosyltransferase/alpha-amylase
MKRMIGLRKQYRVFGRGSIEFLPVQNRKVLAYIRHHHDDTVLCVANLSRSVQPAELDLSRYRGLVPVEMLGSTEFPRVGELPYFLTLGGYAFYWFRLQHAPAHITARIAHETRVEAPEAPALLAGPAWDMLLDGHVRNLIERDLLLGFLQRQRWYGSKARPAKAARFVDWGQLRRGEHPLFLTFVGVEFEDGGHEQYFLPLTISAAGETPGLDHRAPHAILANITGARKGVLFDAAYDDRFAQTLLEGIEREQSSGTRRGTVRGQRTTHFSQARGSSGNELRVWRPHTEQSNTSIAFGDRLILKLFRRVEGGINPDYELGRYLTEKAAFTRVPAVAGGLEYSSSDCPVATLGMLQRLVESQADGWTHATDELSLFYDHVENRKPPAMPPSTRYSELISKTPPKAIVEAMGGYVEQAARLGRRTAEMHLALAAHGSDRSFAPEPFGAMDLEAVARDVVAQAQKALDTLGALDLSSPGAMPPDVVDGLRRLFDERDALMASAHSAPSLEFAASKIRIHGDYHLAQVLWAEGDFYILDFEGEPARSIAQRREKQSALKDVAGMVRSFSYAAYAGLFAHAAARPEQFHLLEPWARVWQATASAAFLRAYFTTADRALFVPADEAQRDALLRLFVLGKALYELNYELNSRPDWVRIPLLGIFDILNAE